MKNKIKRFESHLHIEYMQEVSNSNSLPFGRPKCTKLNTFFSASIKAILNSKLVEN